MGVQPCRGGCCRLDVTNFLDVLALACANEVLYWVQIAGVSGGGIGL